MEYLMEYLMENNRIFDSSSSATDEYHLLAIGTVYLLCMLFRSVV